MFKGPRDFWNFQKSFGSEVGILVWNGEQLACSSPSQASTSWQNLAELWQGVVLERLDRLSVVEFLYAVSLFRADIIHFEVLLVLLLQEPFDVIQRA